MSTHEQLKDMLIREYDVDPGRLRPEARLEDIGLDSLGVMELMFRIEDVFGVKLPPEEVPVDTVQDVVAFIERLQAAQPRDGVGVDASAAASHGAA